MSRYIIFAAIGPLLGGFLLLLVGTPAGYWDKPFMAELGKLFTVLISTIQYTYLFGVIPALMTGAVDDILYHIKRIGPVFRMLLTGAFGFVATALLYGTLGSETGVEHYALYGLVGLVPATLSSLLAHKIAARKAAQA